MNCVGFPGFIDEVVEASVLVAAPPVVEGSSRYLGCGTDLIDWHPLPTSSDAPAPQLRNVSWSIHVGTLNLSAYLCVPNVV